MLLLSFTSKESYQLCTDLKNDLKDNTINLNLILPKNMYYNSIK